MFWPSAYPVNKNNKKLSNTSHNKNILKWMSSFRHSNVMQVNGKKDQFYIQTSCYCLLYWHKSKFQETHVNHVPLRCQTHSYCLNINMHLNIKRSDVSSITADCKVTVRVTCLSPCVKFKMPLCKTFPSSSLAVRYSQAEHQQKCKSVRFSFLFCRQLVCLQSVFLSALKTSSWQQ